MILRTRIRLNRMSAQKNDRSHFLSVEKDATPAFPLNLPSPSRLPAIPTQPKFAISEEIRESLAHL